MKTKILFFAAFILTAAHYLLPVNSFAKPTYQWAKNFGGTSTDRGNDMAVDASGNVYVIGDFFGTADFDPGAGTANLTSSGFDIFFAKYDVNGNYLWAKRIGSASNQDRGQRIAVDGSGNVYITGVFGGTTDFDPEAGTANLFAVGSSEDVFFAKYDVNGNYLWANGIGSTGYDVGYDIVVDASGNNVYITGSFAGTADFDPGAGTANLTLVGGNSDIFFAKYNFNGNYVWAKGIGSTSADAGNAIAVDGSGNVYITGYFYNTADFDPGAGIANLTSAGTGDIFFAKYDSNGGYLWAKGMGSTTISTYDAGKGITVDGNGNVYVTGFFDGTVDFDPSIGTANLFSSGIYDIFFGKYDSNGNYLWAKGIGSTSADAGNAITVGANGNVYITGYFNGTADFDPGAGTSNLTSAGAEDIFFAQYTPSGFFLCAANIGATNTDYGNSMVLDGSGNVYLTGYFQGTADFNPGAGTNNLTSAGGEDVFFAKYSPCVSLTIPNISSTNVLCSGQCSGAATASPAGGTSPYTYNWSNGQTTQTATGLCAVIYTVTVTDAASSVATATVAITQPAALAISISTNPATCGNANGSANSSVSGGITPYTFSWSNGATGATATGLPAGTYTLAVADANGCTKTATVAIAQPAAISSSLTVVNESSCGATDGSASAGVSGGTLPYSYSWSNGQTNATATGLTSGTYTLVITDANGCTHNPGAATVSCPNGVTQLSMQNEFIIFPNPASGIFTLDAGQQSSDEKQIIIYNVYGEKIYNNSHFQINSFSNFQIDLSVQPSGIYFINIKTEHGIVNKKIIIQK
ncbi:MAG: T9SS type A sorting domain-containing protein [Bacteroidetes bacterium]|nr:MAG: T9SS type A sorting domain-containing protein [Bacteroidota bacterium]